MTYQALYRSWRPQVFGEIVGQEHIVTTLINALKTGRVAHAYLFSGPRGTGKTSTAKVLAKALNCQQLDRINPEPCGQCSNCQEIAAGSSLDVIEIDAASNRGIDEIRDLREKARFSPAGSRYKVYIVDEVHMLTTEAFNALLKTLEEPPAHVVFILATTDPQRIPLTVLSRCQRFDFHRLSTAELIEHLEKICKSLEVHGDPLTFDLIAKSSEGCMRDAISLLDQVIAYCGDELNPEDTAKLLGVAVEEAYFQVADLILESRLADCILFIDRLMLGGKDIYQFTGGLIWHFRNLLLLLSCGEVGKEQILARDRALKQAEGFGRDRLFGIIKLLSETMNEMKYNTQPRISLEVALVQMVSPPDRGSLNRVEEKKSEVKPQKTASILVETKKEDKEAKPLLEKRETVSVPVAKKEKIVPTKVKPIEDSVNKEQNISLDQIQRSWKKVLSLAAGERPGFAGIFREGKPFAFRDNRLMIGFPFSIHSEMMEKPENKQLIATLIEKVLGQKVQVFCTELPQSGEAMLEKEYLAEIEQANDKPAEQSVEENDPLVNGLLTMFSGEVVPGEE
jgi:DNA polymerase-3 subunit gamma/tau